RTLHPTPYTLHPRLHPPLSRRDAGARTRCGGAASAGGAGRARVAVCGSQADLGLLFRGCPAGCGLSSIGADLARWAGTDATGVRARRGRAGKSRRGERHSSLVLLAAAEAVASGILARARIAPESPSEELPDPAGTNRHDRRTEGTSGQCRAS